MNAKLCKRLRREARTLSVGMPALAYSIVRRRNKKGEIVPTNVIVHPNSTRGIYRALKKAAA